MFQDETSSESEINDNNVTNDFEINKFFIVSTVCEDLFRELSLMITVSCQKSSWMIYLPLKLNMFMTENNYHSIFSKIWVFRI